jgi:hypothetical protein
MESIAAIRLCLYTGLKSAIWDWSDLVSYPRVFADFHNADPEGRLRLNCVGTIEDLPQQRIELREGQVLTLYSEELEGDGAVQYSEAEKVWVAQINWGHLRQVEDCVTYRLTPQ